MVRVTLKIPQEIYEAIEKFAEFTGISDEDYLSHVVQEALRTQERVLAEQSMGRVVVALEKSDLVNLAENSNPIDKSEVFPMLLSEDKISAARDFLWEKER